MEFTVVDAVVALIIVLSGVLAWSRGLTRELFAIGGWILAGFAAFYLTPTVQPLMSEIPVAGDFFAANCVISLVAAFTLIVAVALLILSIFTPLFSSLVMDSAFGIVDKILGLVFGIARGLLLIAVAFLIVTNLGAEEQLPELQNAGTRPLMVESAAVLEENLPESVPDWFKQGTDALLAVCSGDVPASPTEGQTGTTGGQTGTTDGGTASQN